MSAFTSIILSNFPFEPTSGQHRLAEMLAAFVTDPDPNRAFVLKGYAGTGKTSLVSALVKSLPAMRMKSVLLAPTGRAAKVISGYAGVPAFTIHRKIYRPASDGENARMFLPQQNLHTNTIFIVDEASMIGEGGADQRAFGGHNLLDDLFHYVYEGVNCRLLLIGDSAQLPPVGMSESPALNIPFLQSSYSMPIESIELKEVMRQVQDSGVLYNATKLRIDVAQAQLTPSEAVPWPKFELPGYEDIRRVDGYDLPELLQQAYDRYGPEETIVICRSNKRAVIYNQQIRTRIRWQEDEIAAGDHLMVVKNNYHWLPKESKAGFIANGDIAVIKKIRRHKEMYGFRYADVVIELIDYPDEPEIEATVLLDTLTTEAPALTHEQSQQLYHTALEDYMVSHPSKGARFLAMRKDPFLQALQVKFAYAVTCHKAQGGQWKAVFVEQGYLTKEMLNVDFLRWLYTALTRTTEQLFLVNFSEEFF